DKEKKKKESIFDLSKYIDKTIRVKFQGGREASGVLKGFDPLLNLVLDGTIEYMRGKWTRFKAVKRDERSLNNQWTAGTSSLAQPNITVLCIQFCIQGKRKSLIYSHYPDDQLKLTEDTRQLGLVVCRGTSVVLICPQDGMEAIPNPFIQQQDG
ncbi:hypothetical protein CCH79_00007123, partial [Gambusia affinis]